MICVCVCGCACVYEHVLVEFVLSRVTIELCVLNIE